MDIIILEFKNSFEKFDPVCQNNPWRFLGHPVCIMYMHTHKYKLAIKSLKMDFVIIGFENEVWMVNFILMRFSNLMHFPNDRMYGYG